MMSSAEQFAQQAGVRRSGDDAESRTGAAISSVSTMFETDNDINANPRSSKKEGAPLDLDNHHYASEHLSLPHEISLIFLLSAAQLFTQASLAISIVPLLIIAPDLGMQSDGERSWATAAYSLTVGTGILLSGRWGDCWGHKRMVLVVSYALLYRYISMHSITRLRPASLALPGLALVLPLSAHWRLDLIFSLSNLL